MIHENRANNYIFHYIASKWIYFNVVCGDTNDISHVLLTYDVDSDPLDSVVALWVLQVDAHVGSWTTV